MAALLQSFRPVPGECTEDQSPTLTHPVSVGASATPGLELLLKLKARLEVTELNARQAHDTSGPLYTGNQS